MLISACMPLASATPYGPRTIVLDGDTYTEDEVGGFVSWRCVDYVYGGRTLVEVGTFQNEEMASLGFVLYDGDWMPRQEAIDSYERSRSVEAPTRGLLDDDDAELKAPEDNSVRSIWDIE